MRVCIICGGTMEAKRKQAKYCSRYCKYKANKNLVSIEQYSTSINGRARVLLHNSRKRDPIGHSITLDWVLDRLTQGFCERTGIPFELAYQKGRTAFAPSLDKINPHGSYTEENTQMVIWMYNTAKNIFTDSDVLYMAKCLLDKAAADGSLKNQTSSRERK